MLDLPQQVNTTARVRGQRRTHAILRRDAESVLEELLAMRKANREQRAHAGETWSSFTLKTAQGAMPACELSMPNDMV
jgi:hypothetical protein